MVNDSDSKPQQPSNLVTFRNPKRERIDEIGSRAAWFPYYASFSVGFVQDAISHLNLKEGATLLDPWLGAGTTAEVATAKGLRLMGYDLNPAVLLISRARTIPTSASRRIPNLFMSIAHSYKKNLKVKKANLFDGEMDPLEQWLQPSSAASFRMLERTVESCISGRKESAVSPIWRRVGQTSSLLSIMYVALFRVLRYFTAKFQSSNPTWVKTSDGRAKIQLSPDRILNRFQKELYSLHQSLLAESALMPSARRSICVIDQASSLELPVASASVDAAISSPPYCTRIDYVRATLPELAVIGYPNGDIIRGLRDQMIGTPTINKVQAHNDVFLGPTCTRFLSLVEGHSSKASSTYYLKYYRQYFASIVTSLIEIDRVLKRSGKSVLVVQDSYYKEIKNDLPRIFVEIAQQIGWTLVESKPFDVKQTLAGVNPEVKRYRNMFKATESILIFSK